MPTRLLLEGRDIEGLLARIRDEHGSAARIVQADRVRSGGIAGFFARQRFEVAVEVDETVVELPPVLSLPPLPRPTTGYASDILELVEDIDTFERAAPAGVDGAVEERPDLSTGSDEFARVLARLTHDVAGDQNTATAIRAFEPPRIPSPRASTEAVAEDRTKLVDAPAAFSPAAFVTVELGDVETASAVELSPLRESPLRALGVPEALAPRIPLSEVNNTHLALARMVAALPEAPSLLRGAGQITVVVGDGAYAAARVVAKRARLDPDAVLLASRGSTAAGMHSRRDIAGPVHARRRAPELRESDHAVVIALDLPPGRENLEWARAVLVELAPQAVWALVDATRKPSDVGQQIARLGHVDALVVERTEETADPASVLGLGVPIAQLDGRRASGAAWSALLGARLAEDGEP